MLSRFGKNPYGEILDRILHSSNYIKGAFRNRERMSEDLKMKHPTKILYGFITQRSQMNPSKVIPTYSDSLLGNNSEEPSFLWLGHSSYFLFWKSYTILVDPILSDNASPVYKTNLAFKGSQAYSVDEIPPIDILIITHDHFDHLDYYTITKIYSRVKFFVCPLGVESHLLYWGVPKEKVVSLDWDQTHIFDQDIKITSLSSRHNSGRTTVRNQTLWSAFFLQLGKFKLFLAGDGGYGVHFKTIGELYGPFDFGTIENGQYNTAWPANHMFPHQSVQAALDLKLEVAVPIHWGKFALSYYHKWNEPVNEFVKLAEERKLNYSVPQIGQLYHIYQNFAQTQWWNFK
ncbi:MAG: MBL fold metallo-hydrolase [Chitinophagales bacterium]|nr:MBL fold metallo-hydrolase [Chitinophagales bacterium]MCZ2393316.1 MBL fold metallo-hydrolase [Chitinophagales bacterium]